MCATLDVIPAKARQVSLRKWWHLLGILISIAPDVAGVPGVLTRLQHALRQAWGRRVPLLPTVPDKLGA